MQTRAESIVMDPTASSNLNRLLSRLERNILDADSEHKIHNTTYERNKIGANIEHARTLLLTLEKQSASIRIQTQRQQTQAELQRKRDLIKQLTTRLQELEAQDAQDDSEEEDSDAEAGENVLDRYGPARTDTEAGLDTGEPQGPRLDATQTQELRSRQPLSAADNLTAASSTAREQLFADRPKGKPDLQNTEMLMSHNRTEQEGLTEGLIGLARALKESSIQFNSSLAAEKDVLKRAEGGLDKSAQGMESAGQRMGALRRMSEGQGWWGRIKLYGFILGLWIACFLLVFVGPKLRF